MSGRPGGRARAGAGCVDAFEDSFGVQCPSGHGDMPSKCTLGDMVVAGGPAGQVSLQVVQKEGEGVSPWCLCRRRERPSLGRDVDTKENRVLC